MHSSSKKPMNKKPIWMAVAVLFVLTAGMAVAGLLSGSEREPIEVASEAVEEKYESGFIIDEPGSYDSEDTAVVKAIDAAASSITLMNIETGKYYTLGYDGTTTIEDKYGGAMAMSQVSSGDIVDVTFLKTKKSLTSMRMSDSAWVLENVEKYSFNTLSSGAEVGSGVYSLAYNPVVVSDGEEVRLEDIVKGDVVSVRGVGNSIYSVVVEAGHGYLRLSNDEYLKGGWIEVGQSVIQEITEEMLLVVPEGTYDVHLTASGIDVTRQVTISRNQETILDVSDVKPEEPKSGSVIFTVKPSTAVVYIDGNVVDISMPVELEYGIHQLVAEAVGYETVKQFVKVGDQMANISITLEEEKEVSNTDDEDSSNSVSGNTLSGSYKVYIDNPSDVEVYLDNVYMGVSPISFKKVAGTHTITLRKTGYVTKSYTVEIDDTEKDVTYSFTDLVKEGSGTSTNTNNTSNSNTNNSSSTTNRNNSSSNNNNSSSSNKNNSSNNNSNNSSSNKNNNSSSTTSGNSSSSGNSSNNSSSSGNSSNNSSSSGNSSNNSSTSSGNSSNNNSNSNNSNNNSSVSRNQIAGGGIIDNGGQISGGGIINSGN